MWKRLCELDANSPERLPLPTRIVSNEEFIPPPQTPEMKLVETHLWSIAERAAARLGMNRRDFLRTGCGLAAGLVALNRVFGPCYAVDDDEVEDREKVRERWPKDQFIFDVQTHHVDVAQKWYDDTPDGRKLTEFFRHLRAGATLEDKLDQLNRDHYVKEIFFDSDTVMAVISGVPSRRWDQNPLPPDQMAATRDYVNKLAGSERVLAHGLLRPNLGESELDEMERQVRDLKISAWKMYTGAELGEKAWWMDDESVAYPCWEKTKALGVRNLCVHKGLPIGLFNEEHCQPRDLLKAAKDWPDLNFIVYHSGFRGLDGSGRPSARKTDDEREIPWISDIFAVLRDNPDVKNIYFELGSTFGQLSAFNPVACMHMLGQMIQTAGTDHILWGTDSIWGGSPQSQIERLRRLTMRDELRDKYGYPDLTDEIKNQILGGNAAALFGIDPAAKRAAIEHDRFSELRRRYLNDPWPSNTQYGWVWIDSGDGPPQAPVGG
jgi:hypothetical protein